MAQFWLTPIIKREPLLIGASRFSCLPEELPSFRDKLHKIHPRFIPMFKAKLLLSDENDDAEVCGAEQEFDLSGESAEICFDGNPFTLSHCAEAFFDLLPAAADVGLWLERLGEYQDCTAEQRKWVNAISAWHFKGFDVIFIREG